MVTMFLCLGMIQYDSYITNINIFHTDEYKQWCESIKVIYDIVLTVTYTGV